MRAGVRALLLSSLALALLACGGGGGGGADDEAGFVTFESFAEADVVFGQPIFAFNDQNQNLYRGYFPIKEGNLSHKQGFDIGQDIADRPREFEGNALGALAA